MFRKQISNRFSVCRPTLLMNGVFVLFVIGILMCIVRGVVGLMTTSNNNPGKLATTRSIHATTRIETDDGFVQQKVLVERIAYTIKTFGFRILHNI